jgi:uncharacterized protein (TIGR02001 family)
MEFSKRKLLIVQILIGSSIFSNAYPCHAELHGTITGTTNYVYRGYSKSDNDPAIQANVDYQHLSGLYVGTSVSNVNFGDRRKFRDYSNIEFTPYLGYSYKLNDDWRTDVQWTRYLFDGKIFGHESDYNEFYLFLHYRDMLTLRASVSDSFYGSKVVSGDYEATIKYPLTDYLEATVGVGYLQAKKVLGWDYLYWNAGIIGRYKFISAELQYVQSVWITPFFKTDFAPNFLDATAVFSLSVGF